ncbi:MAG TPA: VanZ family protein [Steroidobacteraceae bacterium]|nr:VanZ family protein [Steroidobacteraceae bacterium]
MNLQRVWWALGVVLVVVAILVCLVPIHDVAPSFDWNDKASHLVGHGTLALYFAGLVPRRSWWKIFVFLLLMGVAIEFAQYFMQLGRSGDPRDVLANSAGAALGLLAGRMGGARWPELGAWLLGRRAAQ